MLLFPRKALIALAAWLPLSSCATIINQTKQSVAISSQPTNAEVTIDQQPAGHTPLVTRLKRKQNHIVTITLEGYQPHETTITHGLSGWFFGNILFGGLIGVAIDAWSGGMYKLTPDQVQAVLAQTSPTALLPSERIGQLTPAAPGDS